MSLIWFNPYMYQMAIFGTAQFNATVSSSKFNLDAKNLTLANNATITSEILGYTSSGSPTYITTGGNNNGPYVNFVGTSSQYFYGNTNLTLNTNTNGGFTFVALVKITSASASEPFARLWTGNDASMNFIEIVKNGSTWQFVMNGGGYVNISTPSNTIVQNQWHVLVCRYQTTGKAQIFKNGTSVVETATSTAMNNRTFSNLLYIGKSLNADPYLSMHLSHLSIYDKPLTDKQITDMSDYLISTVYADYFYNFTKFTFTNANITGNSGPTLAQLQTAYTGQSWLASYFSLYNNIQGYQQWIVPETQEYLVIACGARGGGNGSRVGGRGNLVVTKLFLTKGMPLIMIVGQMGENGDNTTTSACGGGGGTFIVSSSNIQVPLMVASGGGGAATNVSGSAGKMFWGSDIIYDISNTPTTITNLNNFPALISNPNAISSAGIDGSALLTAGAGYSADANSAKGFANGLIGGLLSGGKKGGFGGGGGGGNGTPYNGGGGGGWNGGKTYGTGNLGGAPGDCYSSNVEADRLAISYLDGFIEIQKIVPITGMISVTFNSCGLYGSYGPTYAQQQAYYTNSFIKNYLNSNVTVMIPGCHAWVVPASGTYTITAVGGNGENSSTTGNGGKGGVISSDFVLSTGDLLMIVIGQTRTGRINTGGAGGGATWVAKMNSSTFIQYPLIGAGGGGGAAGANNGADATATPATGTSTPQSIVSNLQGAASYSINNQRSYSIYGGKDGLSVTQANIYCFSGLSDNVCYGGGGRNNASSIGSPGAGWTTGTPSISGGPAGTHYCANATYTFSASVLNTNADGNGSVTITRVS